MSLKDKIAGTLAGMVYGDAFGVPGELWPREKVSAILKQDTIPMILHKHW